SRGTMRVKPLAGLRISIRADLDVRATRFMVDEIPAFPTVLRVGRVFRRPIFLLVNQVPLPGSFFLRQPFPRFIPEFMRPHVANDATPSHRLLRSVADKRDLLDWARLRLPDVCRVLPDSAVAGEFA